MYFVISIFLRVTNILLHAKYRKLIKFVLKSVTNPRIKIKNKIEN